MPNHLKFVYLDLPFDKRCDVIFVLKDGEGLQQVMLQPLPVLCDLLTGGSCRERKEGKSEHSLSSQEEHHHGVMFQKQPSEYGATMPYGI